MTHPLQGTLENRDGAWVLTLTRDIAHPAERVWPWLTDPDRLRRWSPIVPDTKMNGRSGLSPSAIFSAEMPSKDGSL